MPFAISIPVALESLGKLHISADIYAPASGGASPVIWYALPGGSFTKHYFNVRSGSNSQRSFAAAMTALGHIVVAFDPVGIGDSERPPDAQALNIDSIGMIHAAAIEFVRTGIMAGTLIADLPAQPKACHLGVGHSMGGALMMLQQGTYKGFSGVALLGSSTLGMEMALTDGERRYVRDPQGARAALPELVKARFGEPFPAFSIEPWARPIFAGEDETWSAALALTQGRVLGAAGLFCMFPDGLAPEAAQIDVPVFLAFGDADIPVSPHGSMRAFSASRDVSMMVLPKTGHMHFGFASAPMLFDRLAHFAHVVASQ